MRFEKSPPSLVRLFDELVSGAPVERRSMFGYPCAFVGGQMCAGLFADSLFVRLGEADRAALLREPGAEPFQPMPGRPMREYVAVPRALHADPGALRGWLGRAVAYARTLPPKASRRKAARGAAGKPARRGRQARKAGRRRR